MYKARELRANQIKKRSGLLHLTNQRLTKAQQHAEETRAKIQNQLQGKLETAEQMRAKAIDKKVEKAKRESDKLGKANEVREEAFRGRLSRITERLEKVDLGSTKKTETINGLAAKAKDHSQKVI